MIGYVGTVAGKSRGEDRGKLNCENSEEMSLACKIRLLNTPYILSPAQRPLASWLLQPPPTQGE